MLPKSLGGRPINKKNYDSIPKIRKMLKRNPNISNKKASSKLKIPKTTYVRLVKMKLGYKTFKKTTVPKYNKNQESRVKKSIKLLIKKTSRRCCTDNE